VLSEVRIKSFESEDRGNIKFFAEEINRLDKLELSIPERMFEYILLHPHLRDNTILAYHEEQLVAFAACIKNSKEGKEANFEIIVHPSFRNKGLGKTLFNIIDHRSKEYHVSKVTAFAKEHMKHSVKFLENRGFQVHKYMWKMDYCLQDNQYKTLPVGEYSIRQLTLNDIKNYVDIMNAGFKKEGDVLYNENSFQMLISNPEEYVFFIEQQGVIVATAAIGLQKDINRGYIHNVTVYHQYRGQGFGEITLIHCLDKIKEIGLYKAALNVDGENKNAMSLYKKIGFVEVDTDIMFKLERSITI
jgi:ribosomal protein S18 acetylase RimI-like enzyme